MSLSFSIKRIEETCVAGSTVAGSFILNAKEGKRGVSRIAFILRSSHRRIRLSETDYNGILPDDGLCIGYEISSHGFDPGTIYKGSISVISDQGEDRIPITLSVIRDEIKSSRGPVRNLFHFANLAKEDFEEAVSLFYTEDARRIFEEGDRDTFFKYRAFCALEGRNRGFEGVEEFLIETGKKTPVLLSFAEASVMEKDVYEDREITITVRKSGWGYPGFRLYSADDFIEFEKNEYSINDFEGNFAEITFRIKSEKLHSGHNFGCIWLSSLHSRISIPVFVDMSGINRKDMERRRMRKAAVLRLMKEFISYRIGDITAVEWIQRSNKLVERLLITDRNDPESRLLQTQLLLAAGRYGEADIILSAVEREMEQREFSDELMAYFIYLRSMCDREKADLKSAVRRVWDIYNRSPGSWRILWILIYLDETIKMSPERERSLIEELIDSGVRSPLIYLEAYSVLSHDPLLIRKLSDFEINVLLFAVRHGLMKREISDQVSILSQRIRGYDPRLLQVMGAYYKEFNDDEMLSSICSYIIRNGITDKRHFAYFAKAVERDIGVTNLYDFYLYTMNQTGVDLLPKNVLMYYSMKNDLPPAFRSYVYANMIVNEDEAKIYLNQSRDACIDFAAREILSGHMDENLAIITDYLDFFRGADSGRYDRRELEKAVVKNGFIRLILVDTPGIGSVTVVEDAFNNERNVPVKDGRAYISVYDSDYQLFFEDSDGRRYGDKYIQYEDIKLLRLSGYLEEIDFPETDDPGLWLALSEMGRSYISINEKNSRYVKKITGSALFYRKFKEGLLTSLLRFYFDNDMQAELSAILEDLDVSHLTMEERTEYVRFCSMREDDDEALRVITEYGSYGMDPRILMRISTGLIEEKVGTNEAYSFGQDSGVTGGRAVFNPDPVLLEIASTTFRDNKYNEVILDFLSRYYEGTTRELKDIWKACLAFEADASIIEGRIIEQMLATGAYIGERDEIFFDYLSKDASKHVVGEYFRKAAEDNFINDTILDDRLFIGLLDFAIDEKISDIEALCLIRFYEGRRDMRSDRILYPYIRDLAERDIVFDFFISYKDLIPSLELFQDFMFVEHRNDPGYRVILNYCLEDSDTENPEYRSENMKELYPGLYQSRGIIFPGETLQYYITVDGKGHTFSDIERAEDRMSGGDGRFEILQDALTSLGMGDNDSFVELCEDYIIKDRIVKEIIWAES